MRVLVDGDGCPGRNIIESVCIDYNVELLIYCDLNHIIESDYAKVKYVDSGFQSVDMYLINECEKSDIVITQDFGVGSLALGKGAMAINPLGHIYTLENIDRMLFERYLRVVARKTGAKHKNQAKRKDKDNKALKNNLIKLIEQTQCEKNNILSSENS